MKNTGLGRVRRLSHRVRNRAVASGLLASRALGLVPPREDAEAAAGKSYGRIGNLEVRLAATKGDIRRAQRLRYQVFYEEMSARASLRAQMDRRDRDPYDGVCDHLLVVDHEMKGSQTWQGRHRPKVVGTYRVLGQEAAQRRRGFYTQGEYDIAPLLTAHADARFLELGRSCVLKPYRSKRTVELLWHGLWTYVREHGYSVMIGCASFPGTDPEAHAMALSYLHHHRLAPPEWRGRAHDHLYVPMNRVGRDRLDAKAALRAMPPLIKAYLRVGAFIGDGAVVDHQFGTTDVLVILPVVRIDPRYFEHFGAPQEVGSRIALVS
jgi:L-ornithine Nalpha-acyltransferase